MAKRSPLFIPQNPRPRSFPISFNSDSISESLTLFLLLPTSKPSPSSVGSTCSQDWTTAAVPAKARTLQWPPGCSSAPLSALLPAWCWKMQVRPRHFSPDYHLTRRVFPNLFGVCRPAWEEAFVLSSDVTQCLRKSSQLCLSERTDSSSSHVASILPSTEAVDCILKFHPCHSPRGCRVITWYARMKTSSSFWFTALFTSRPGPGLQHHLSRGAEEEGF